jgi:hypothetical protein
MPGRAVQAQDKPLPDIKTGGYAKVDFIQDLDAIGNAYEFKTNSIPVDARRPRTRAGRPPSAPARLAST